MLLSTSVGALAFAMNKIMKKYQTKHHSKAKKISDQTPDQVPDKSTKRKSNSTNKKLIYLIYRGI